MRRPVVFEERSEFSSAERERLCGGAFGAPEQPAEPGIPAAQAAGIQEDAGQAGFRAHRALRALQQAYIEALVIEGY